MSTIESIILRLLWLQRPGYVIVFARSTAFLMCSIAAPPNHCVTIEKRNHFVEQKIKGRQHEKEQGYSRDGHPRNKSDRSFCFLFFPCNSLCVAM